MAETIKERLTQYARKIHAMGQTNFERMCGISVGTISAIGKGISTATLEKILKACPDLNVNWLITGIGDMQVVPLLKSSHSESFSGEVGQVSEEGEKRENRGGLAVKADDIEYLRNLCRQQQDTIMQQQATISTLNNTLNYILKK